MLKLLKEIEKQKLLKKSVFVTFDIIIFVFSFYLAILIRLNYDVVESVLYFQNYYISLIICVFVYLVLFFFSEFGNYSHRFFSLEDIPILLINNIILTGIIVLYGFLTFYNLPRSIPAIFFFVNLFGLIFFRIFIKECYKYINRGKIFKSAFIFGAGEYGRQIFELLNSKGGYRILGFVDDDISKQGRFYKKTQIFSRNNLLNFNQKYKTTNVFIAISSINLKKKKNIENFLRKHKFNYHYIPSIAEILNKKFDIEKNLESFFNKKEKFSYNQEEKNYFAGKKILIFGAGGSIGSEISRQVVNFNAREIYLVDSSEYNLFQITSELRYLNKNFKSLLGSIVDENFMNKLTNLELDIIINAAAYKHVNLVEKNKLMALKNNFYGNYLCCELALKTKSKNFILISTDKAVEPLTFMGLTKRLCELMVLYYGRQFSKKINFCSVRFGNVINSSGSVIPIFQERISKNLPLELTDPKMKRYFMTIEEASRLVLLSLTLNIDEKICYLNMGSQISIIKLAKQMIRFSGKKYKVIKNKKKTSTKFFDDHIPIVIVGKKENEKFEEKLFNKFEKSKVLQKKQIIALKSKIVITKKIVKLAQYIGQNKIHSVEQLFNKIKKLNTNV